VAHRATLYPAVGVRCDTEPRGVCYRHLECSALSLLRGCLSLCSTDPSTEVLRVCTWFITTPTGNTVLLCEPPCISVAVVYVPPTSCHHDLWNHDLRHVIHVSLLCHLLSPCLILLLLSLLPCYRTHPAQHTCSGVCAAGCVRSIELTVAIATPKHSEEHTYGSPVPGTLDALLSQRYYLAGARGLSGLPIPRLTS